MMAAKLNLNLKTQLWTSIWENFRFEQSGFFFSYSQTTFETPLARRGLSERAHRNKTCAENDSLRRFFCQVLDGKCLRKVDTSAVSWSVVGMWEGLK